MDLTPHLDLPFILPQQALKHITHNEALRTLDAVVQLAVLDRDVGAPPASPSEGARYLVGAGASGEWAGQEGRLSVWQDGGWTFLLPRTGWLAWIADEGSLLVFNGAAWVAAAMLNPAALVGVNATADTSNRFAVSSPGTLFTHEGSNHRLTLNKATPADTASVVFQTGYSGRAEFGLAGDDNWSVKVSADGATWRSALIANKDDGVVALPNGATIPDGKKITNPGTSASSGLDLEGGGNLGRVGLVIKSVVGLTGARFEQRSTDPSIDLIDFGFKTLTQQMNLRVESRSGLTVGGNAPEMQVRSTVPLQTLFAISATQAASAVPISPPSYLLTALPLASSVRPGAMVYVSDATGGAVPAFSDGTVWRRVTDRTTVS